MYSARNGWALDVAVTGDKSGIGVLSSNSVRCFHFCMNSLGKSVNPSLLDPAISKVARQTEQVWEKDMKGMKLAAPSCKNLFAIEIATATPNMVSLYSTEKSLDFSVKLRSLRSCLIKR